MPIVSIKYRDGEYEFLELKDSDLQHLSPVEKANWIRYHCVNLTDTEWAMYQAFLTTCKAWHDQMQLLDNKLHELREEENYTQGARQ